MISEHCNICNKIFDQNTGVYNYCSYTCFISTFSDTDTYMDCKTMYRSFIESDRGKTLIDNIYPIIFKYLEKYKKCRRCYLIYDSSPSCMDNVFCSLQCFFNVNREVINTCTICKMLFVDNGWGTDVCSRLCDRMYDKYWFLHR